MVANVLDTWAFVALGFSLLTLARRLLEKERYADIGFLGACGSFLYTGSFLTCHGPEYILFSIWYLCLSRRACSSHVARSAGDNAFHASDTTLEAFGSCYDRSVQIKIDDSGNHGGEKVMRERERRGGGGRERETESFPLLAGVNKTDMDRTA